MTKEEIVKYIKSELAKDNAEIYLDVDDYKIILKVLERDQKPYEKFQDAKQHIYKLASDYKCWDNRLTHDEALELCHLLDQELQKDEVILTKKEYRELVSNEYENGYAKGFDEALEDNSLAIERYQNLVDYFDDENAVKTILGDEEEFNKWLKRTKWYMRKADELGRKLESEPCNDAVSRKDVMDQIFYSTGNGCDVTLDSELRKRIEGLSSVIPVRNWIPCSERLPEKGQQVLVTQIFGETTVVYGTVFPFEKRTEKYITAWMPKPEPYKAESENENGN